MFSLLRWVLDAKYDDFRCGGINSVVDQIGEAPYYQLPDALGLLRPTDLRKQDDVSQRIKTSLRTRTAADGLRA
jgi:hypothetical protein